MGFSMPEDGSAREDELADGMTDAELARLMDVVRSVVPPWCRQHEEFEGVAAAVIIAARRGFDRRRGRFEARLAARARNRVARDLYRNYDRPAELLAGDDVLAGQRADGDPYAEAEARADVRAYLSRLPEAERQVAACLASGLNQAETAAWLGMHPRRVSRIVASLAPGAADFFDHHPRRAAA